MESEVYTGKMFQMKIDPKTKVNTIQIEVELNDIDFIELQRHWVDNLKIDLKFLNIK